MTTEASTDVGEGAARGVLWLTAQKWLVRLSGLVTIAVLTRLLRPEDFGMVAAASTLLPLLYLLADLGFAAYIVQVPATTPLMLSTGFWFSVSVGVALTGALAAAAPVMALPFGGGGVTDVIRALSVAITLTAASSVPVALLRRRMQFRLLAAQGAAAALVAQAVAIALALLGWGVWALVGQALSAQIVSCLLAWISARWVPSAAFSWPEFRTMASFGSQVLGVELVATIRAWAEAAVVSSVLGIAALGYLNVAQRLVQVVLDLTGSAIAPVTEVAFAKIRDSTPRLRDAYLRALGVTLAVLPPPLTVVAVAGPLLIPLLFSDAWAPSHPVAQVLALASILAFVAFLDHGLFYGAGRPGRWFGYALAIDALTLAVTVLLAPAGLLAVALGFLGVTVVATVVRWFLVGRLLDTPAPRLARPFGVMFLSVAASGLAGLGVLRLTGAWTPLLSVVAVGGAVLLVHLGLVGLLARPALAEVGRLGRRLVLAGRSRVPG